MIYLQKENMTFHQQHIMWYIGVLSKACLPVYNFSAGYHDFINLSLTSVSPRRPWDPRGRGFAQADPTAPQRIFECAACRCLSCHRENPVHFPHFWRWPLRPSGGRGWGVLSRLEATVQHSSSHGRGAEPWLCAMRWGDADKGQSSSPRRVQPVR